MCFRWLPNEGSAVIQQLQKSLDFSVTTAQQFSSTSMSLQRFEPLLTFWRCLRPAPTVVHAANLDDIHDVRVRDFFIVGEAGAYLSRIAQWIPCDNDPRSRHQRGLRWAGYAAVCQPLQ